MDIKVDKLIKANKAILDSKTIKATRVTQSIKNV